MGEGEYLASRFPASFLFGAATAAYQIEGATREDGRGLSIWDTFSATPGKVRNGDTGAVACDHYHRFEADLDLLTALGVDAYRFSIAWPRILPQGTGRPLAAGLAFYDRLVDAMLARGIKPFATLYHWDLPQALEDRGGWRNRDTARAFADYAETVTLKLGDRLETVATLNEPWCSAHLSHLYGIHAPGLTDRRATMHAVHHLNLAHGLGAQAVRAVKADLPVGVVLNTSSVYPGEATDRAEKAARRAFLFDNSVFLDPLLNARYPGEVVEEIGDLLPESFRDDMADIRQPMDFLGLNYYTPSYVFDDAGAPWPSVRSEKQRDTAKTDIGWDIVPEGFTHMVEDLRAHYTLPPLYITENGACDNTGVTNGAVDDRMRVDYLESHIDQVAGMVERGIDIRGYFVWSLLDNFEWAEGYAMRFGIVHVDYDTQVRTPKASYYWYQALCGAHG